MPPVAVGNITRNYGRLIFSDRCGVVGFFNLSFGDLGDFTVLDVEFYRTVVEVFEGGFDFGQEFGRDSFG